MSRRSKKKRRNRVTVSTGGPYNQDDGKPSPSVERAGHPSPDARPSVAEPRDVKSPEALAGHPNLPREVLVFGPEPDDIRQKALFTVPEWQARQLHRDKKVEYVKLNNRLAALRILPAPAPKSEHRIPLRTPGLGSPIHRDSPDNPTNCFSIESPVMEWDHLAGKRKRVAATCKTFRSLPSFVTRKYFSAPVLECLSKRAA